MLVGGILYVSNEHDYYTNEHIMVKKQSNVGKVVAVSAGIAALSVGAYLLFGPNGKKNRKTMKSWMVKMKGDVLEKLENVKEVTGPMYDTIVDQVSAKYRKLKNVDPAELAAEIADLKKQWNAMTKGKKKAGAKKVVKKVTKKKK